jgi:hypothetical protein
VLVTTTGAPQKLTLFDMDLVPAFRVRHWLMLTLALLTSFGLTAPAAVASSGSTPPRHYFGMHYSAVGDGSGSWPDAPVGFVRLWDSRTSWNYLQPARDGWDFSVLDAAVANASAHGAEISLVLGQTPAWASSRPAESAYEGAGAAAPPASVADWWTYVNTVAARYRGRIASYEIWNETNLPGYFSGTVAQMVRLTRIGRDAVKRADPGAAVLGPSVTLRTGTSYLRAFAKAGGYRFSDVVNIHGYPGPYVGPEGGIALVDRARREISQYPGGRKPVWNTELNFGLKTPASGGKPAYLSSRRQAAYVARAYLLNWSHGVRRLAWYNWSDASFLGVRMSSGGPQAAAPGAAFANVRWWMRGRVQPCTSGAHGAYQCTVRYSAHRWGSIRWMPHGSRPTRPPTGTFVRRSLDGSKAPSSAYKRVRIGYSPVLFVYHR